VKAFFEAAANAAETPEDGRGGRTFALRTVLGEPSPILTKNKRRLLPGAWKRRDNVLARWRMVSSWRVRLSREPSSGTPHTNLFRDEPPVP